MVTHDKRSKRVEEADHFTELVDYLSLFGGGIHF